jgi:hypothetical protein
LMSTSPSTTPSRRRSRSSLALVKGRKRVWESTVGTAPFAGDRSLADDDSGRPPLRSDPGARQVLSRAVDWQMIDVNPAKQGVDNPQRRRTEKRPFESWARNSLRSPPGSATVSAPS